MKELKKEARDLTEGSRTSRAVFQAQHQSMIQFGRAMSAVTSVMHAATAAISAVNLASIALSGQNVSLATANLEVEKAQRAYNEAVREFGEDSPQAKDAAAELNIAYMRLAEEQKRAADQSLTSGITLATSIALIGSSVAGAIPKFIEFAPRLAAIGPALAGIIPILGRLGSAITAFIIANPWILIAVAAAIAAYLIITHWDEIVAFFQNTFIPTLQAGWAFLVDVFTKAWEAMKAGFVWFWNGLISVANAGITAIVKGIEWLVNQAIDSVNALISIYNAAARLVGAGTIKLVPKLTLKVPQIPFISAATGFQGVVTKPTLFLAGEAGAEPVAIGASATSVSSNSSTINNSGGTTIINIAGSLYSEREAYRMVSGYRKRELIRRNFRPY